ncbi:MAG TPA: hypothetical protein VG274_02415 [Rhizomicrobium sp.]|jgi:hypothetical protein|nr:hypothetical protein [Rhizomicrobium sp.]
MNTTISPALAIVLAAIVIIVLLATIAFIWWRERRSKQLRSRFGQEYLRTLEEIGSRHEAEARLHRLEKRVESFSIRALPPEEKARYAASWRKVQADFVDSPGEALNRADELLGSVMKARGYPVSDFEQRSADLSVDHAAVVQNYRAAHDIALRHKRGEADTEALRQAMIHYRALFAELVDETDEARAKAS